MKSDYIFPCYQDCTYRMGRIIAAGVVERHQCGLVHTPAGVLAGLVALHEKMPSKHHLRAVRLISWAAIFIGVTSLAGGKRGLQSFAKALAALLGLIGKYMPAMVRKALPTSVAAALRRAQKQLEAMSEGDYDDEYEDVEASGIDRDKAQLRQR